MAREVPPELKEFRSKVEGSLGNMTTTAANIASSVDALNTIIGSIKSRVEAAYKSSTDTNQAVTKLSNTSEIIVNMKSNIESTLNGAIGKAQTICDNTKTLEDLSTAISEAESTISAENAKEEPNQYNLIKAKQTKESSEEEFDRLKPETETALSELKAMDKAEEKLNDGSAAASDSSASAAETLASFTADMSKLKYGTFEERVFEASNGKKITYSIYIPDYGTESVPEGLPVFMYIHGGQKTGTSKVAWDNGITRMIRQKEVTPSGIVISPYVVDFDDEPTRVALKELNESVVNKYNCDRDRISIGGASYGAIMSYQMVNDNPGYYSACVPISGYDEVTSAFEDVEVWALHGKSDNKKGGRTRYPVACEKMEEIESVGGDAYLSTMPIGHSNAQNRAFQDGYTSPDGDVVSPLEWAFRQSKKATKAKHGKKDTTTA